MIPRMNVHQHELDAALAVRNAVRLGHTVDEETLGTFTSLVTRMALCVDPHNRRVPLELVSDLDGYSLGDPKRVTLENEHPGRMR